MGDALAEEPKSEVTARAKRVVTASMMNHEGDWLNGNLVALCKREGSF